MADLLSFYAPYGLCTMYTHILAILYTPFESKRALCILYGRFKGANLQFTCHLLIPFEQINGIFAFTYINVQYSSCMHIRAYIYRIHICRSLSLILSITVGLCTDQYWRNRDVPFRANHIAFGLLLYWGWQPVSVCLSNSNKKRWCHSMCGYFVFTSHCSMECFDTFFFFFASFDSFFFLCVTLCCLFSNPRHQQFGYFENYFTQFSVEYSYDENVPIHVVCCIWWICFANA